MIEDPKKQPQLRFAWWARWILAPIMRVLWKLRMKRCWSLCLRLACRGTYYG